MGMSEIYLILAALLVTAGYSVVVFRKLEGHDYNAFRRQFPELVRVIGGYTAVLFAAMLSGLLLMPLIWPEANLLHIISLMLYVYALGQALLELTTGVAVWLRRRRGKHNTRTISWETYFLQGRAIRYLGLWRLVIGLLLAGGWWLAW